jgi:hypothetical protein
VILAIHAVSFKTGRMRNGCAISMFLAYFEPCALILVPGVVDRKGCGNSAEV